ncbi:serine/threonine-protein kinase pim-1-like isoform X2 [Takifugu rubripes]|uniref:non-specific serine/threonine protein kinase n=1 Tax=Takifugu rubripes TaxID=31033 RepID=A0A674NT17_TAKRU|nr:serine/threonine-protein kinase pim-1-like isoform X2 [Takifugu rubripes]
MLTKTQAKQKLVQFDNVTGDTDRRPLSTYNLRPRKRKNLFKDVSQAKKGLFSDSDQDRISTQELRHVKRRPTPFPLSWHRGSRTERPSATRQEFEEKPGKSAGRKTSTYGQRRKKRKILSNSDKQKLRAIRTAVFQSKYKEMYMIGRGGFGDVFAGSRIKDNLPVAIKHIPQRNIYSKLRDRDGNRIPTEVALMLKLTWQKGGSAAHVQLLDWYDLFNQVILVLERPVPSVDLFRYCRYRSKHILGEDQAKAIMKQLIVEVKFIDNKGIFHRDLKLENILIKTNSEEPQIWVIDFGVGCFYTKRSVYRVFQGTPQHVPPEYNLRGRYRAGPTTVWQLGVVLFEMLHDEDFSTIPFLLNKMLMNKYLSAECLDFLDGCLKIFPMERKTLEELQFHPWLNQKTSIFSLFGS